jgi:predicted PurR-regulated permease PerM
LKDFADAVELIESMGYPVVLIVGFFVVFIKYIVPMAKTFLEDVKKINQQNADNFSKLTDKSIEIQESNSVTLAKMEQSVLDIKRVVSKDFHG